MKVVADLHLHSKYSRAVSQQMVPQFMAEWAVKKGIDLLGTADWTHPLWLKELEANLEEHEHGIYKLKESYNPTRFVLSTEISCIYSQGGKLRRIHIVVLAPSFETAEKINDSLKKRGCNLLSDGRPIIGLTAKDLAELIWSVEPNCLIIPAHVWTPWFSLYGSKSGFDSIDECFGNFAKNIYAVETGLSSDPLMNWQIKELDNRSIVSFSDAHSLPKLGRELTIFQSQDTKDFSFSDLANALKQDPGGNWKVAYTLEFYPEEGKYHYTGHRSCGIRQSPEETKSKGAICPVCGKPLTVGVMHRVQQLSRGEVKVQKIKNQSGVVGYYNLSQRNRPPYVMMVPLLEILSESENVSVTSIKLKIEYENLTNKLGSELQILTQINTKEIAKIAGVRVAEGIAKVREGNIVVEPGYDGVFGVVKIWPPEMKKEKSPLNADKKEQMTIF